MYNTLINLFIETVATEPPKLGLVGGEGDDGNYAIVVEDDPNSIYVRIQDGGIETPTEAINLGVPKQPDYPVIIFYKNKQPYAVPDQERSADYRGGNEGLGTVGPHSHEKGFGLWDVVSTRRLREGQVTVTVPYSLSVDVASMKYWDSNGDEQFFIEGAIDLTSLIPVTSEHHCFVKVYLDTTTGLLGAKAGTSVSIAMVLNEVDLTAITLEANEKPLAGVLLTNGMTVIDDDNLIYDWRFVIQSNGGGGAIIDQIMTDENGDVLSDENGDVLIEG